MRSLSLVLTAVCMLTLSGFVFVRNPRQQLSRAFGLFGVWGALWAIAVAIVIHPATPPSWYGPVGHLAFVSPMLSTSAFVVFALIYPAATVAPHQRVLVRGVYLYGLMWGLLATTSAVYQGTESVPGAAVPRALHGPLFVPYALSAVGCTVAAIGILLRKYRRAPAGRDRTQLFYVLMAVGFSFVCTTVVSVVLPAFGERRFSPFAPLTMVVPFVGVALAITKHRLFRLGVVFRQVTIRVTLVFVLAILLAVLLAVAGRMAGAGNAPSALSLLIIAAIVAPIYPWLRRATEAGVDHILLGGPPTDAAALRRLSRELTTILSVDPLAKLLVAGLGRALRVQHVTLFLADLEEPSQPWHPEATWPEDHAPPPVLSPTSPLLRVAHGSVGPVIVDEATTRATEDADVLRAQQTALGADVIVPLVAEGETLGLLVLGEKFNGDMMSDGELDVLTTLAHQASTALANAMLHEQILRLKMHNDDVLRAMVSGVIAVDRRGKLTTCNRRAAEMLGRSAAGLLGESEGVLPDVLAEPLRAARLHGQANAPVRAELPRASGGVYLIGLRASVLRDTQGQTIGALAVFEDQTAQTILEEGMQRADRLASLGTLAAGLAHEIKNPLVAVRTLAQLLPTKFDDPEFRDSFATLACGEVDRINDLVERLLQFARPSAPHLEWFHLDTIVDDVLQLLRPEVDAREIGVDVSAQPRHVWIYADQAQMRQVLLNLFINALQAMEDAPERQLSVRLEAGPGMDPSLRPPDHWLRGGLADEDRPEGRIGRLTLTVRDTGPGIPEHATEDIFNPFFTTKPKGSGLGLAVVARIIREHGGTIAAESVTGTGACLVVHFPAYIPLTETAPQAP